jgi:hypothetical protein
VHAPARPIRPSACDESGFVGGSLFGDARVFTHASIAIDLEEAGRLLDDVRRRLGGNDGELKASRLNRSWARPVADWLLAPDGPLRDRVSVHVTDTRLFGFARLAQVLSGLRPEGWWSAAEDVTAWDWAGALSERLAAWPDERVFLDAGRDLLWLRRHRRMDAPLETWLEVAQAAGATGDRVLAALATPAAEDAVRAYVADPPVCPLNEPLLPALWSVLQRWSAEADPVVVHDEQSVLTSARVAAMAEELCRRHPERRLASFRRVDSRDDVRVQLADLVAGVVRRTLEDRLTGGDDEPVPVDHLLAEDSVGFSGGRAAHAADGPPRDLSPGSSATG